MFPASQSNHGIRWGGASLLTLAKRVVRDSHVIRMYPSLLMLVGLMDLDKMSPR